MLSDAAACEHYYKMIKPPLFKYRLEKAIIIYEMWGSNIKINIDIKTRLCVCMIPKYMTTWIICFNLNIDVIKTGF